MHSNFTEKTSRDLRDKYQLGGWGSPKCRTTVSSIAIKVVLSFSSPKSAALCNLKQIAFTDPLQEYSLNLSLKLAARIRNLTAVDVAKKSWSSL